MALLSEGQQYPIELLYFFVGSKLRFYKLCPPDAEIALKPSLRGVPVEPRALSQKPCLSQGKDL